MGTLVNMWPFTVSQHPGRIMLRDGHVRLWQDVVQAAVLPIPIERIKDGIRMAAVEKEVSQVTQLTITHKKKKAGRSGNLCR